MSAIPNNVLWNDFFSTFQNLPSLWKVKDDVFKDKDQKNNSWNTLLQSYRAIFPKATLDDLKKKILGIKSCYRRELKKVRSSEKSGCGSDEVHVPSLWYFDQLSFLADHEQQTPGLSSIELNNENEETEDYVPKKKKKTVAYHLQERNELLRAAIEHMTEPKKEEKTQDEAYIYGKSWSTSFRKLSSVQQIFAKKAIEDIMILGQLNQLNYYTVPAPIPENVHEESVLHTTFSQKCSSYDSFQELLSDTQFST